MSRREYSSLHRVTSLYRQYVAKDYTELKAALERFIEDHENSLQPIISEVRHSDMDRLFDELQEAAHLLGDDPVKDEILMHPVKQIVSTLTFLKSMYTGSKYSEQPKIDAAIHQAHEEIYPAMIEIVPALRFPH